MDAWVFAADYGERLLKEHFDLLSLDGCGFGDRPFYAAYMIFLPREPASRMACTCGERLLVD